MSQGYTGQGAATAERFVPDAWSAEPGGRLYRTGDLARHLPDGTLELLGRLDHQVKIRGFRVEPGEIEAVLAEHPGVDHAVVLALPEPVGDELRLGAYVVANGVEPPRGGELRGFVNDRLPAYMVPAVVLFLDRMPLTPNGKVDRRALAGLESAVIEELPYTPPETETERSMAEIWQEVLGCERVGRDDDFFDLGGHSLLAMQVISRVRDRLKVAVPLRSVFEEPCLARFAEAVDRCEADGGHGAGTIRRVSREVDGPAELPVDLDALSEAEVDSLLEELIGDGGASP